MEYMIRVEPGVRVYVNDINPTGAKTILFLHGWPANYKLFEYQYNVLPHHGYRCIGIDTRGFGKSDRPWNGYSYDRLADDIYHVIKELNLHNVALLGHSTGGAQAIRYMGRYNGYGVSRLILCAAAAPSFVERPYFPEGVKEEVITDIIEGAYTDRPKMLNNFGNSFFHTNVSSGIYEWLFQMGLEAASWSTIAIANDWLVEETFNDLLKIHVPTLIMHGVHDQIVPFALSVALNEGIRRSKLVPFENSGHGLFYDEIDKFNYELSQFVR